jgi:trehalose-phosphatase
VNYFFRRWDPIRRVLSRPDTVLWLFDFDGTLTPIARHPKEVHLRSKVRRLLRKLGRHFPGRVGVLSGRPLAQIRRKVRLPGIIYGGTHGFEMAGPRFHWKCLVPPGRFKKLEVFAQRLKPMIKSLPGAWMEDKRWTRCLHYREIRKADRSRAKGLLASIRIAARRAGLMTLDGLQALEIMVGGRWGKGPAMRSLLRRTRTKKVFYMGDDRTDEDVFRLLGPKDIGVRVGRSAASHADYYLKDQSESEKLLERLLAL